MPQALATKITESIHIPTIGIGAGAGCDGQVLVYQDMLAMYSNMKPKFVKQFAQVGEQMREAFRTYKEEVAAGTFPGWNIPLRWMKPFWINYIKTFLRNHSQCFCQITIKPNYNENQEIIKWKYMEKSVK